MFNPTRTSSERMRGIVLISFLALLVSCAKSVVQVPVKQPVVAKVQPVLKEVQVTLKNITAQDLQENLTLRDELLMQVSVVRIVGEQVFPVDSKIIYLGKLAQGQQILLDTVGLKKANIQPGERIGVQLALWELDDYAKDQAFIHQVNQVGGLMQIPMALLEWSSLSNPVSWFIWGARLGSFGLDWWAKRDLRDLLGVSEVQWAYEDMSKGNWVRYKRGNWKGGQRGLGAYQYGFGYEIRVKDSFR